MVTPSEDIEEILAIEQPLGDQSFDQADLESSNRVLSQRSSSLGRRLASGRFRRFLRAEYSVQAELVVLVAMVFSRLFADLADIVSLRWG